MTNAQTTRTCTVRLDSGPYQVTYRLIGKCTYLPAKLGRAPEDCVPDESFGEVHEVTIERAFWEEDGWDVVDPALLARLLAQVNKLPLDDYLFEGWMIAGGDFDPRS